MESRVVIRGVVIRGLVTHKDWTAFPPLCGCCSPQAPPASARRVATAWFHEGRQCLLAFLVPPDSSGPPGGEGPIEDGSQSCDLEQAVFGEIPPAHLDDPWLSCSVAMHVTESPWFRCIDPGTLEALAGELSRLAAIAREEEHAAADERRRER